MDYTGITNAENIEPFYLSGNIPVIRVPGIAQKTTITITITRNDGDITEIKEDYYPHIDNTILISLQQLVHRYLENPIDKTHINTNTIQQQPLGVALVEINAGQTPLVSFRAIKGVTLVERFVASENFFRYNWLTIQPQTRLVGLHDIIALTFFSLGPTEVIVRHSYSVDNGSNFTIDDHSLAILPHPNMLFNIFTTYSHLLAIFPPSPPDLTHGSITFFFRSLQQFFLSWGFRVVLKQSHFPFKKNFLFENSMAGIDAITFTGEEKQFSRHEFMKSENYGIINEYETIPKTLYTKNTGPIESIEHKNWISDFFASNNRYVFFNNEPIPIFMEEYTDDRSEFTLDQYEFTYGFNKQNIGQRIPERLSYIPLGHGIQFI